MPKKPLPTLPGNLACYTIIKDLPAWRRWKRENSCDDGYGEPLMYPFLVRAITDREDWTRTEIIDSSHVFEMCKALAECLYGKAR